MAILYGHNETFDELEPYFKEIKSIPRLTPEKEKELGARIQKNPNDLDAKNELIRHNLGLPVFVAKKYIGCGIPFADLIQEGNIGLIQAANSYNPEKKTRFYSFAYSSVKWRIFLTMGEDSRLVHLPRSMRDISRGLRKGVKQSKEDRERRLKFLKLGSEDEIANLSKYNAVSINHKESNNTVDSKKHSLLDLLVDSASKEDFEKIFNAEQNEKLRYALKRLLKKLSYRDRHVVEQRFGLTGNKPMHFSSISNEVGFTKQNIYSIYKQAITKLQRHTNKLREYA